MRDALKDARRDIRRAMRSGLLAMRSMVDARIRRLEEQQAARSRDAADAPGGNDGARHEIV